MQLTKAVFVVGCLVAAVGSQIQAKQVVSQLDTPLSIACLCSIFLPIFGAAQWSIVTRNSDLKKQSVSQLLLIALHFSDITTFFVALKYSSVSTIGITQLAVVNLWQLLHSPTGKNRGISFLIFIIGIVLFLLPLLSQTDRLDQLGWSVLEIISAAIYALVNHYLHHFEQRWVDQSQFLQSEILASCSIAVSMAPFAWLELNTIDLKDSEASSLITSIVIMCILVLVYRRSGSVFNSLSYSGTAMFIIASTISLVVINSIGHPSPELILSAILMAFSAYLSSLAPPLAGTESRSKLYFLLALCAALLLFHCTMILVKQRTLIEPAMPPSSLNPLQLDPDREFNRLVCLRKVRERIMQEVGTRFVDGSPYAFMDFPMHWNLGDNLIWHGTQTVLEVRGQFPVVTDPDQTKLGRNLTIAKQLIKDGVILLQGGGNFGDVWRGAAIFRLNATKEIKNNDLIWLPQSISYSNTAFVKADNEIFKANNRTFFMFRDYASLQFSLENFKNKPAIYVPDMAFALGPQTPNANPVVDIVFLLRLDKEKVVNLVQRKEALKILSAANVSFEVWDFPVVGFPLKIDADNKTIIYNYTAIYPKQFARLRHTNRHAFMGIRTLMANNLFSRGRMVITDRLHASIMTTLMGKPLIYLDNSYKKITNVRSAMARAFTECTDENLHARHSSTLQEAAKLALGILNGSLAM